ncbi:MAG: SynChlorMet cassette protein ScmC [Victivallaceae bacterium]|nr:SynChlorMet cassette protein ScmC [Victivallaceae bacterium]
MKKKYQLTLADGRSYGFAAVDPGLNGWMDEFVHMTQMPEHDGRPLNGIHMYALRKIQNARNSNPCRFPGQESLVSSSYCDFWYRPGLSPEVYLEMDYDTLNDHGMNYTYMCHSMKFLNRYYFHHGGGIFHAAFAALDGQGILISAPGNTGKSTSLARLPDYWNKLADDIAMVIKSPDGRYRAHPFPTWSDYEIRKVSSSCNVESSFPLAAIFFLEQSQRDKVTRLSPGWATQEIILGFSENLQRFMFIADAKDKKSINLKLLDTAVMLAGTIPCYTLEATLDGRFWEKVEKILRPSVATMMKETAALP